MPLAAALSMRFMARRRSSLFAAVPALTVADLMRVRSSLLTALLRSARLAFVMMRFFWLLMFATAAKATGASVPHQLHRQTCRWVWSVG